MTRTKVIVLGAFAVTFAAGVAAGLVTSWPKPAPQERHGLAEELNLDPKQQEKMREIWSAAMRSGEGSRGDKRRALSRERDEAVAALLTEEQKPAYEKILQDYRRKVDEQDKERRKVIEDAVKRTRAILTPEQARKYDELRAKRDRRGPGSRRGGTHGKRTGPEPGTRPSSP